MSIEIEGLEIALGRLDLFTNMDKVNKAIDNACLKVEAEAVKKCPKGEVQLAIKAKKAENAQGGVYVNHRLAPYIEYGTGIFSIHPKGGRKEVPWVYVEGQYNDPGKKTIHTEESADRAVAMLRAEGLPGVKTYGSEPQPFLRPALDENKDYILHILGESLIND